MDKDPNKSSTKRKRSSHALWIVPALIVAGFHAPAGQEVDRVVVSPVQPYLIPIAARASADVVTQRNNHQRTGTTFWRGLDQSLVSNGRFGFIGSIDNLNGVVLA